MKNRVLSLFLALALLAGPLSSAAWAAEAVPAGRGTREEPYQIAGGEELTWLADYVNQSATNGQTACAVLTADIDLKDVPWSPIGKYGMPYASVFDGQGHRIEGMNVTGADELGLFGCAENATIQNLVVRGVVTGGGTLGGILGRANKAVTLRNCGNEAVVSGSGTGGVGGVVGKFARYGDTESAVSGCYNAGRVSYTGSGYGYAGGVVGYDTGETPVSNCYNTGTVTSGKYAGGIRGNSGSFIGTIAGCYNAGTVTGDPESNQGGIAPGGYNSVNQCFYLDAVADANDGATAKTEAEMRSDAFVEALGEGWKRDDLTNGGLPILAWQETAQGGETEVPAVAEGVDFIWAESADELGETVRLITPIVAWSPISGVESYDLTVWREYFAPDPDDEEPSAVREKATTVPGVSGMPRDGKLAYDLDDTLEALGEGRYYVTVTAAGTPLPSPEWALSEEAGLFGYADPYDRMARVTGLRWEGTRAVWTARPDFDQSNAYLLTLYRSEGDTFVPGHSVEVAGCYHKLDCGGYFAVGGAYAFTVTALSNEAVRIRGFSDSPESRLSSDPVNGGAERGIYTVRSSDIPGGEHGADWVAITDPQQWMELANLEDTYDDPNDPTTSVQAREWSKKYYLANDLDFSSLPVSWAGKGKSIGNVTHRFMGVLDGNGHKLTGLTLSGGDGGLFSYIGSTGCVYGLTVEGANVLTADNAAVLARNNFGTIEQCAVVNSNITTDTGGVVGGMASRNYGVIRESYVEGGSLCANSTTATGYGGFVGANEEGGRIERCWTSMPVDTQSDYAGGFVGLGYGGVIRDCFALGEVSARGYSGGFVGRSAYNGNRYENCYAAGTVTVTEAEGHGFIGGNKPDSAFQYDQSEGVANCWYHAVSSETENYGAHPKALEEMTDDSFLSVLNQDEEVWGRRAEENSGLPYLLAVKAPEGTAKREITVTLALAGYDKDAYAFFPLGETVSVALESDGNTRVVDVMDAAQDQGLLTYSYDMTPTYGRYIHTINGRTVEAPDGWMFTLNDMPSDVSASLAAVEDGDRLLWFEGTTENRFQGPTWAQLAGEEVAWKDIATVEELLELANSSDPAVLADCYRLAGDLDLAGVDFPGIGSVEAPFTGVFDGRGRTLSNVTVTGVENVGVFNVLLGAAVKNLTLTDLAVSGVTRVGGLVGWAQAQLDRQDGRGSVACLVGNCAVSGTVTGQDTVGGLVGLNDADTDSDGGMSIAGAIHKSHARVAVAAAGEGAVRLGGMVGENRGTITESAAYGSVRAPGGYMVGGAVGANGGAVYGSYAQGEVAGGDRLGGFVGLSTGALKGCYSLGGVTGTEGDAVGGFAGSVAGAEDCVSAGQVSGGAGFAGLLNGRVVGLTGQINVKNVFGNCFPGLSPVGNTAAFSTESQQAALAQMKLEDRNAAAEKLYELFGVRLPGLERPDLTKLMDAIAGTLTGSADGWTALDMALYARLEGKTAVTTREARQAALDKMIREATGAGATAGDRARLELTLRAIGVDSTKLYPANSAAVVNNAAALAEMDLTGGGYYAAPWILLAGLQGNVTITAAQREELVGLLETNIGGGLFDYEWDGVTYASPDTAGIVLAALAPLYDESVQAKAVVDTVLAALPGGMDQRGSFGNANADAMVIIGLIALGRDPWALRTPSGASLVDGLLSHVNETGDGFLYAGAANALATEQGFRALVALALFDGQTPCNIYDFSATAVAPGRAESGGQNQSPGQPSGQGTVRVQLTLRTDAEPWITDYPMTLRAGSTVYHALERALSEHDMTANGLTEGYIKSVTRDSVTLAEFDRGPNSGWLYQVNGVAPEVSFTTYSLKNGDRVLWYYTADWTRDPVAGSPSGGVSFTPPKAAEDDCARDGTCPIARFADADIHAWYHDGIHACLKRGLMTGTSVTTFEPGAETSRAMIATILWRMAGSPESRTGLTYPDCKADSWYAKAVAWGTETGILKGYGTGDFGPDDPITREQLALMLWRYAKSPETSADLDEFVDGKTVSDWVYPAMEWAVEQGIITGKGGNVLDPQGCATRAEAATMLARYLENSK